MAWLFIDTHSPEGSRYAWLKAGHPTKAVVVAGRSSKLLPRLAKDWRGRELDGVCVVVGPGRFTSVRTGVLYANLMSRLLSVPLVGIRAEESLDLDALAARLPGLPAIEYAAPVYDAEPNITLPRP